MKNIKGNIKVLESLSIYRRVYLKGLAMPVRFDTDEYVVRVLEPEAEDVYAYAEAINEDKNIDDYEVYYIDSADHNGDLELNLQGRTLYITNDQQDMGLALASDAPAVVIQDEYSKTDVKTEFTTVKAAIAHLADRNDQTSEIEYDGKIFAVLNTNGSAAWIVFDSRTGLNTTSGIDGEKAGNVPTKRTDTSANATYTVAANGRLRADFVYNAPEFVADGSNVDFDVIIYVDGKYYDRVNSGDPNFTINDVANGQAIAHYTSGVLEYYDVENVSFEIVNETGFNLMKVRFFDVDGKTRIENKLVAGSYTTSLSTTVADEVEFQVATNDTTKGVIYYGISGTNSDKKFDTTSNNWSTTAANAVHKFGSRTAAGNAYVDVILDLSRLATKYVLDTTALAGKDLEDFGVVDGTADKAATLNITATPTSWTADQNVKVNVKSSKALSENFGYKVTLTINGKDYTVDLKDTGEDILLTGVQGNIVVSAAKVTYQPKIKLLGGTWNANQIILNFNVELNQTEAEKETNYDMAATGVKILDAKLTGDKQVTLFVDPTGTTPAAAMNMGVKNDIQGTEANNTIKASYSGTNGVGFHLAAKNNVTVNAGY